MATVLSIVCSSSLYASSTTTSSVNGDCPSLLVVKVKAEFLEDQPASQEDGTQWGLANWRSDQSYRIKVAKVLIGTLPHDEITARAIAHGQLRDDRSFRLLLEDRGTEGYWIVSSLERDYRTVFPDICRNWAK